MWFARAWRRARAVGIAVVALALLVGCERSDEGYVPVERKFREFQRVYPVLLRDCGFPACHGAPERFFRVWGPGRVRLGSESAAFDGVTGAEASASFEIALSMIDAARPERSLLLRKPLAIAAGGTSHGGNDNYGRNVYRTRNDAGYLALERWVLELGDPE